jgi:hypothetical protein
MEAQQRPYATSYVAGMRYHRRVKRKRNQQDMKTLQLTSIVLFAQYACGGEARIDAPADEASTSEPIEVLIVVPDGNGQGGAPSERPPQRPSDEPIEAPICDPGEVWRCLVEDGSCGIQICIDGYAFTVCSEESPHPFDPATGGAAP